MRRAWPLVACIALGSTSPARADDWPSPGLNAPHTRSSGERSGAAFADGTWSHAAPGDAGALASPVVSDGVVVSAKLDGTISAVAADTGRLIWQVALGAGVQGTPAISSGRVLVPTLDARVVALALADGTVLWSTPLGGLNASSPAMVDGDLIVGAGLPHESLVRLDATTGAIVWETPPGMEEFSNTPPAVAAGLVVVGTNGGHYYAFDATTGIPRWDYRADGIVNIASPLIAGGRVYLAGGRDSDHVHAVDMATGAAIPGWPITLPTPAPDLDGVEMFRRRAVSSFASAANLIVLQTRLDSALDTNKDGNPDQFLSRESVVALDPGSGGLVWQRPVARVVFPDPNAVPGFVVCPTPAAFLAAGGMPLLAVASSLGGTLSILDAASGTDDQDLSSAGRALASPVLANGRLITVSENGTIEGRLSSVNHPPAAPLLAANPRPLDAADVTLHWAAAMDADGDQVSYEVRLDSDGEVLLNYAQQLFPGVGVTSAAVPAPLTPGVTYTFAVRARDPEGAMSGWSSPETFSVTTSPAVTVNGTAVASLRAAVDGAKAGDVVSLGAGTYPLSATLHVPAGVTVAGAGAGRTVLSGAGLTVGVSFSATDAKAPTGLDKATVTGADTCISVEAGAAGVEVTHVVAHDCAVAGIAVAAGGTAAVVNATLAANGTGFDVVGSATIKNSLVTNNHVGMAVDKAGALAGSYDDLFGNQVDRQGVAVGTGEFSAPVLFANASSHDYRLTGPQPSTDKGDPGDAVGDEPHPNGDRINMGAFGGTADAERSVPAAVTPDPPGVPLPTATTGTGGTAGPVGDEAGGCGLAGSPPAGSSLMLALGLLLVAVRRRRL